MKSAADTATPYNSKTQGLHLWRHGLSKWQGWATLLLLHALRNDRYRFEEESWFGENGPVAKELLLRAWNKKGEAVNHGGVLGAIFTAKSSATGFDRQLFLSALKKTGPDQRMPLSINILPSSLESREFWDLLDKHPAAHGPESIILEILEHETQFTVNHDLMERARNAGYTFALDDFSPTENDWKRLQAFAPYLNYIKLDGAFVRRGLKGDIAFKQAVNILRNAHPDCALIAEHVETRDEADRLFAMGIAAVQGNKLREDEFYAPATETCSLSPALKALRI